MRKSHVATMLLLGVLSLGVVVYGSGPAHSAPQSQAAGPAQDHPQPRADIRSATGKLTLLGIDPSRVHHVSVNLDSYPNRVFSFGLGGSSKDAMFDLMREAFVHNIAVEISAVKYPGSSANTITQVSLKR